tara:strand:+ start:190 stop:1029 length:840 start_codon:yes stop_codon:yes gene_type:complete
MGTCIYYPFMGTLDKQNALASLRKWTLIQDNSGPYRVYRDEKNNVYSSVTHILKETAPQESKDALERWIKRPDSEMERDVACERGRLSHSHAEYILKLASKFARQSANKRNIWRTGSDGLERCPKKVTQWSLSKAAQSAPKVAWSASGYARGLRSFILERVTAIHAVEFSVYKEGFGFAGTADALVDIDGEGPFIVDWKTAKEARSDQMVEQFCCQLGAYSLGLKSLTHIEPKYGAVIIARRSGKPQIKMLNRLELIGAETEFLRRNELYQKQLELVTV